MRGFFKTPSLRNVELTGPYFHNGSKATLEDIVFFYTFAGDYSNTVLQPWAPLPAELLAMPAFMKTLTDDRVRFERAPFDHPELCVSTGHMEDRGQAVPDTSAPRSAADRWASIPAVGAREMVCHCRRSKSCSRASAAMDRAPIPCRTRARFPSSRTGEVTGRSSIVRA